MSGDYLDFSLPFLLFHSLDLRYHRLHIDVFGRYGAFRFGTMDHHLNNHFSSEAIILGESSLLRRCFRPPRVLQMHHPFRLFYSFDVGLIVDLGAGF